MKNIKQYGFSKGVLHEGRKGIDYLVPIFKTFLNYLSVPWVDTCCGDSGTAVPSGGNQNLQEVTDEGNITTNDVVVNSIAVASGSFGFPRKISTSGDALRISKDPFIYSDFYFGNAGDASHSYTFPETDGTVVLRVNGVDPDTNGNVTIDTRPYKVYTASFLTTAANPVITPTVLENTLGDTVTITNNFGFYSVILDTNTFPDTSKVVTFHQMPSGNSAIFLKSSILSNGVEFNTTSGTAFTVTEPIVIEIRVYN